MYCFIPRSLCALKRIVAKNEHARFGATTGVQIKCSDGMIRLEATDGRRLVVAQLQEPDKPDWPGFKEVADGAYSAIVSFADLDRAIKACPVEKWRGAGACDLIGIATVGAALHIGAGENCIVTRQIDGRFPDVDSVLKPIKNPLYTFRIDPKLMADQLMALHDMTSNGESVGVDLFYYGAGVPIGFCAKSVDVLFEGLLVPLVSSTEQAKQIAAAKPAQIENKMTAEEARAQLEDAQREQLEELRDWRKSIEDDPEIDASTRIIALKEWDEEHGADVTALEDKLGLTVVIEPETAEMPEINEPTPDDDPPEEPAPEPKKKRGKKPKFAPGT